jgi:hypothetical protein
VKFADPLKNMVRRMLGDMGFCAEDVERMIEGDLKEVVIPELNVTPRHIMVTLGTEWGRDLIARDLWARLWSARVETLKASTSIVTDDVRFANEVRALRYHGGVLVRVERPGVVSSGHESENLDVTPDYVIRNDGTLELLAHRVRNLVAYLADDGS